MPDYGHDLQFGIFPSPDATAAERTLELAQLADVSGLDLVSVQDHPYQGRTSTPGRCCRSSPRARAPSGWRPTSPTCRCGRRWSLARSAATLDLLSAGRVELGLGAGAFWDAIVAAGGPRRTPKEAVDALVEAIGIIRQVWAGDTVRAEGEHYRVKGLHGGPRPAHDIPIWIGSYKPRMLRVTADLADAWIPSMGYADPHELAAMNARIDEAPRPTGADRRRSGGCTTSSAGSAPAAASSRAPSRDWAEQLAGLAIDEGISTFILGTDDADVVRRFALEVAPAVRDQVDAERSLRARRCARRRDRRLSRSPSRSR